MRTSPIERRAEERARRRRRHRSRKRRSDLNRSDFEVARLRRQQRRAERGRIRREQRRRRAAHRSTWLQRWRDRPGRTQRAEARLRRALRRNALKQRLPSLSWYRGLPERSRPRRWEVVALALVAAAASVGVATSGKDLTGSAGADLGWAIAVGTVVALAGTRAPRRVLIGCGAMAAAGVTGWWSAAGLAAMALSSGLVYRRQGHIVGLRVMHAASASLTLLALVHIPPVRGLPSGTAWTLGALGVAALAIAAIVVTGWWNSPRAVRTVTGVFAGVSAVTVVSLSGWLWLEVRNSDLGADVALVAEGTTLGTSDLARSLADLEAAGPSLNRLAVVLDEPQWSPLRAVPLVAQQFDALDVTVSTARTLVGLAGDGADLVNSSALRPTPGRVDLAAVQALEAPLATAVQTLVRADGDLGNAGGPLLLPAVAGLVSDLRRATVEAIPSTELALAGSRAVPGLLGGDGPRTWLVQVVGASASSAQILVADEGGLLPLGDPLDPGVAAVVGNLTLSPDYPTAAAAAALQVTETSGAEITGIITVDAIGAITLGRSLGADVAPSDPSSLLAVFSRTVLPAPRDLARDLTIAASERRLLIWSAEPSEEEFLKRVGVAGDLRQNDGTEDLVHLGLTPDQADAISALQVGITYRTNLDAGTGVVEGRGEGVISNSSTSPISAEVTLVSGLNLESLTVSDIATVANQGDLSGWNTWSTQVVIPASGALPIAWRLRGQFAPFTYTFAFQPQPLASPTTLDWYFRWFILDSVSDYTPMLSRVQTTPLELPVRMK